MATETVINRPAPFVEDIGKRLAEQTLALQGTPVVTTGIAGITQQPGETAEGLKARQDAAKAFTTRQQNLAGLAPQVAQQDALQQQAQTLAQQGVGSFAPALARAQQEATLAGGLGTAALGQLGTAGQTFAGVPLGAPTAAQTQQFMSPYQQQVIDAALADFDLDTQRQQQQLGMQQAMSGTMTGSRAAAAGQELGSSRGMDRALLQANMLNQGFQQAQAARQQDIANRMGISSQTAALGESAAGLTGQDISALGQVGQTQGQLAQSQMSPFTQALAAQTQMAQLVPKLGAQQFGVLQAFGDQNQKYAQAGIDALAQKNKLEQYAPYEQLGFVGQQISGLMGGYGTGTSIGTTAGPQASPGESTFGNFMQGAGILANLGGMFGLGG